MGPEIVGGAMLALGGGGYALREFGQSRDSDVAQTTGNALVLGGLVGLGGTIVGARAGSAVGGAVGRMAGVEQAFRSGANAAGGGATAVADKLIPNLPGKRLALWAVRSLASDAVMEYAPSTFGKNVGAVVVAVPTLVGGAIYGALTPERQQFDFT